MNEKQWKNIALWLNQEKETGYVREKRLTKHEKESIKGQIAVKDRSR